MRRRARKGDFSVRGIAGSHTALLGMNALDKSGLNVHVKHVHPK